jgi:hypothetical protein
VNAVRADHRIGTRGAKRDDEAHGKVIRIPLTNNSRATVMPSL